MNNLIPLWKTKFAVSIMLKHGSIETGNIKLLFFKETTTTLLINECRSDEFRWRVEIESPWKLKGVVRPVDGRNIKQKQLRPFVKTFIINE